jgi:tRNA-2-methylthio-N6-dimethylallyladenosine synthase
MNEYDSELVKTILKKNSYDFTEVPEQAEIIFLNTCSVRENAHDKVHQRLSVLRQLRKENKKLVMGVLGCMAQNLRNELLEKKIGVDIVAGPDSYKKLPEMLSRVHEIGEKEFSLTLSEFETYSDVFPTRESGINAWVAVMRGCDNFCTFCVVPYTRGRERSRDPLNVVEEVKILVGEGFKQVTLLGQNVNSYQFESYDFADLVALVSEVAGVERIRFTSPHPKDFPLKLIDIVANNEKVCRHIHLPLQSGNDRILDLMNRTYTQKEYFDLVDLMRTKIPNLALTTDVIVGFPSESDEDYDDTLKVLREVRFDSAFMFKYSERKQTIAERKFADDVPDEVKIERMVELVEVQRKINFKNNQSHLGKTVEVLVEGKAKKPDQLMGRNEANKIVVFPDNGQQVGDFVTVLIEEVTPNTLIGSVV